VMKDADISVAEAPDGSADSYAEVKTTDALSAPGGYSNNEGYTGADNEHKRTHPLFRQTS
ncbi:MAG: hypothetical protein II656_06810, partial [Ruminococcus sp.]|nr:hypothetical protein [Ruminococcus sp.]